MHSSLIFVNTYQATKREILPLQINSVANAKKGIYKYTQEH